MQGVLVSVVLIGAAVLGLADAYLTEQQKSEILNAHNAKRSGLKETAMTWNSILAQVAQDYSKNCKFSHNSKRSDQANAKGYGSYVGENLYLTTAKSVKMASVVESWFSEKKNYHISSNACDEGEMCGHYTQVVWAKSTELGCGSTYCDNITGFGRAGTLVVCNYGPGGNYVGEKPYFADGECK